MKVRSPLRWRILEFCSWLRCWCGDARWHAGRWLRCVFAHRGSWTRRPWKYNWNYECSQCGRKWTTPGDT